MMIAGCTNCLVSGLHGAIPEILGRALAPSLQLLDLSDNYLTGTLPPSLFSMPFLHTLYLMGRGAVDADDNAIPGGGPRVHGVIPSKWQLPNLKYLGADSCLLSCHLLNNHDA